MQDRISTHLGRVRLTPVQGEPNTYDLVRADDPTQVGTLLDTANLLSNTASATILTLAGVEPENPSQAFIQLSKVLYPLKKNAVGITNGTYVGTGYSYPGASFSSQANNQVNDLLDLDTTYTPLLLILTKPNAKVQNQTMIIAMSPTSEVEAGNTKLTMTWGEYGIEIDHITRSEWSGSTPSSGTVTNKNSGWNDNGVTYGYTVIGMVPDTGVVPQDQIDWEAAVLALIDPTLTLSSHAADAKATGDAISALEARVSALEG